MRYSFEHKATLYNHTSRQRQACLYEDSFLKEDTTAELYKYDKDPEILRVLTEDLDYYNPVNPYEALRRVEDTIVVSFKPEAIEQRPNTIISDDIRRYLDKKFKKLEKDFDDFRSDYIKNSKTYISPDPDYIIKNLFVPPHILRRDLSGITFLDRLDILQKRLIQLDIENRRYQVLNRYHILQQNERELNATANDIYHVTKKKNDTPAFGFVNQGYLKQTLREDLAVPTEHRIFGWILGERTRDWHTTLPWSIARHSIVKEREGTPVGSYWILLTPRNRRFNVVWACVERTTGIHLAYEVDGDITWQRNNHHLNWDPNNQDLLAWI